MKKLFLPLFLIIIASPIWGQQSNNISSIKNTDHKFKVVTEINSGIQIDSAFFKTEDGEFMEIYTLDANGLLITKLRKQLLNGSWLNFSLNNYTYDINENRLSWDIEYWNITLWEDYALYTYTYDINDNRLTELRETITNGTWEEEYLKSYIYNENNNLLSDTYQVWSNNYWINNFRYIYTFDGNGNRLTMLRQHWENEAWINYYLNSFTYDENDNQLTHSTQQFENGIGINGWLSTHTYDTNGYQTSSLKQLWTLDNWVNNELRTHIFNIEGKIIKSTIKIWENNAWRNGINQEYNYNENGVIMEDLTQYWINNEWLNDHRNIFEYDNEGNRLLQLTQHWINNEWMNSIKKEYEFLEGHISASVYRWWGTWIESPIDELISIHYNGNPVYSMFAINVQMHYSTITGMDDSDAIMNKSFLHCFPNPAKNKITIELIPDWQNTPIQIDLFNQAGQKVKSKKFSENSGTEFLHFSVEDLLGGLYMLQLNNGKETFSQKILISK